MILGASNLVISPKGPTKYAFNTNPSSESCPFAVSKINHPTDNAKIRMTFKPGTAGGKVPTNIFENFDVTKTGSIYVKIRALSNGSKITSCTIVADATEPAEQTPTPSTLPTVYEILIYLVKDGVPYRVIGCDSISVFGYEQYRLTKTPPAQPGELVYTPYYIWRSSA